MGLRLHTVPARLGWQWIIQAFRLWLRKPLGFVGLFATFFLGLFLLAALLPVVGGLVGLAMLPMLSLGYMVASRSVLQGGPVGPLQLIEGLRNATATQRRAQLLLCVGYAAASVAVFLLADWVDGGAFEALQQQLAKAPPGQPMQGMPEAMNDPRLQQGMWVRLGLAGLLSVPYWHAAALVHWGGQGALQALFSSTLALWQARAAFALYALGWTALLLATLAILLLLGAFSGSRSWMGTLLLPIMLVFTSAFYVSLWFSFNDSFGADDATIAP